MPVSHIIFLAEEPSMEAFLQTLMPRILPKSITFEVHPFQGKNDLLGKIGARLKAYANWLPPEWRLLVMIDRDDDDCKELKNTLEEISLEAGLISRSQGKNQPWQVANRIVIEELEAWYFGDWEAIRSSFPRVPATIAQRQGFRDPDLISGGTWEAFERVMQNHGYYRAGLAKIEAARKFGAYTIPARSRSKSFSAFFSVIEEVLADAQCS